jgi:hypothetical protein
VGRPDKVISLIGCTAIAADEALVISEVDGFDISQVGVKPVRASAWGGELRNAPRA